MFCDICGKDCDDFYLYKLAAGTQQHVLVRAMKDNPRLIVCEECYEEICGKGEI